ncbi:glycoside hydrolase family 6 protein [Amycolatopsis sp. NPDC051903]|uniref:glycoside hydrolase family 6 protein n=1 Tax=Amycolatopsis sp. NPDC051903 TaxID=3363936 RepID=UPI0037933502
MAARARAIVSAAASANELPVLLADAGRGGACASGYARWFGELANAIGGARALVVVHTGPDCPAAPHVVADSVPALARASHARVLLDVGAAPSPAAAANLAAAGGPDVDGVALNVGGYAPDNTATATAQAIQRALHTRTGRDGCLTVIDSSRNGAAVSGACNPAGARVGLSLELPFDLTQPHQLWLTTPGLSDGPCGTAPASRAGEFTPDLALALAKRPG